MTFIYFLFLFCIPPPPQPPPPSPSPNNKKEKIQVYAYKLIVYFCLSLFLLTGCGVHPHEDCDKAVVLLFSFPEFCTYCSFTVCWLSRLATQWVGRLVGGWRWGGRCRGGGGGCRRKWEQGAEGGGGGGGERGVYPGGYRYPGLPSSFSPHPPPPPPPVSPIVLTMIYPKQAYFIDCL